MRTLEIIIALGGDTRLVHSLTDVVDGASIGVCLSVDLEPLRGDERSYSPQDEGCKSPQFADILSSTNACDQPPQLDLISIVMLNCGLW